MEGTMVVLYNIRGPAPKDNTGKQVIGAGPALRSRASEGHIALAKAWGYLVGPGLKKGSVLTLPCASSRPRPTSRQKSGFRNKSNRA